MRLGRLATQWGLATRKTVRSIHISVMSYATLVISAIILRQWPHEQIQSCSCDFAHSNYYSPK